MENFVSLQQLTELWKAIDELRKNHNRPKYPLSQFLITHEELMALFRINKRTANRWRHKIGHAKFGRYYFYKPEDVIRFINENYRGPKPPAFNGDLDAD